MVSSHRTNIYELEPELTIGKRVKFFREPDNPYDEKAIVLRDEKGNKLGYIPRDKNEILSRCVSRSENRSCTGFEPHSRRSWNRTFAAHLTARVTV